MRKYGTHVLVTMGQALTSCCFSDHAYEDDDSYQKNSVIKSESSDDKFPDLDPETAAAIRSKYKIFDLKDFYDPL